MANCSSGCCGTDDHQEEYSHQHNHDDHDHSHSSSKLGLIISLVIFFSGLILDFWIKADWFTSNVWLRFGWYFVSYILVAFSVFKEAVELAKKLDFFNEFSLMGIATVGAFAIGEFPEGVAVMLFYTIGEMFQESAVNRAQNNIKALLDVRPKEATVFRNEKWETIAPNEVKVGEKIQIKVGEKVPLDGILISEKGSLDTSALTGESKPSSIIKSDNVLAGMLNLDQVIEIETTKLFENSSIVRILQMVQDASSRKAKTELFIRKFAKVYTPIVFVLALVITFVPYFFVEDYIFRSWLYRGLVFLVISCPCALVVSIPLSYFGGIGLASRKGILFKGGNYMDAILNVGTVVFDKTGTLTTGVFAVTEAKAYNMDNRQLVSIVAALERASNHPVAKAIVAYENVLNKPSERLTADQVKDIPGYGIAGNVDDDEILVGSLRLMDKYGVGYPEQLKEIAETIVVCSKNNHLIGYILLSDALKDDAMCAVKSLRKLKIRNIQVLSGDKQALVDTVVRRLKADKGYGDLLPEGKVEHITVMKKNREKSQDEFGRKGIAFVGDGINDAPVLAMSDVSIAVGGAGSDVAVETADIVLQDARPSKVAEAITIARHTRSNVIENITMAIGVKVAVLVLGVLGVATMWEAVFADVGVTVLAIFNALRLIRRS